MIFITVYPNPTFNIILDIHIRIRIIKLYGIRKQGMHVLLFAQEYLRPQTDVCCNVAGLVIASHQFHPVQMYVWRYVQKTRTNKSTSLTRKGE
jgi:hypothetical protein